MFKFEELCELIRLVGSTEVASFEIEHQGGRLRIDGKAPVTMVNPTLSAVPATAQAIPLTTESLSTVSADGAAAGSPEDAGVDEDVHYVVSPIVGTFYRAPNPDADPYIKVGDVVDSGKTLCIVEAMKLMNEIESDISGTIVKVLPGNAEPVEFGERLFAIRLS